MMYYELRLVFKKERGVIVPKAFVEVRIEYNKKEVKKSAIKNLAEALYSSVLLDTLKSDKICLPRESNEHGKKTIVEICVKVRTKGYDPRARYGFSPLEIAVYVPHGWWHGSGTYSKRLEVSLEDNVRSYSKKRGLHLPEDCRIFIKQIP